MRLFRACITDDRGKTQKLLIAAQDEREAFVLARRRGRVRRIDPKTGARPLYGESRIIGAVLHEFTS